MRVLLWISANLVVLIACQSSKVNVDVYFEALCPDSHNFIITQLYPNWEDIKDYVHIRFIPFGKSTVSVCTLNGVIKKVMFSKCRVWTMELNLFASMALRNVREIELCPVR